MNNHQNIQNIQNTLQQYHHLVDMARRFLETYDDGNKRGAINVSFDEEGNIFYEKNTACHCHPEYTTYEVSGITFGEWLNKQTTD